MTSLGDSSQGSRRRWLRGAFVAALAGFAIATSLPNLYYLAFPMYGTFGVVPDANNVVGYTDPRAAAAGVKLGDRVIFSAMPLDDRYVERFPLIGRTVTYVLERAGVRHTIALTAKYYRERWVWALWSQVAKKIVSLLLIVIGSALFVVRPTRLSRAFFIYALSGANATPMFFSFLPMVPFFAIIAANDAIWAAGASAFLWLSLNIGGERPHSLASYVPLGAFAIVAALVMVADAQLMLAGQPADSLYNAGQLGLLVCYAAGFLVLVMTALKRRLTRARRLAAGWLAIAGTAMIVNYGMAFIPSAWWQTSTFTARIAVKNASEIVLITNILASLAFAYVIIRERVVDTGLVVSRIFWYGAISLGIAVALAIFNWAFAPQLTDYPFAIPLEAIGALGIGFWLSGFRDVAGALGAATVDAPRARAEGRLADERAALAYALRLAQRTGRKELLAEVRGESAFSAWVGGDDDAFERHVAALRAVLGPRSDRGLGAFANAAALDCDAVEFDVSDLPEWKARALLVLCGRTTDASLAQKHARDAVVAADESGLPFLRVVARVTHSELSPGDRQASLNEANALARNAGFAALSKSIIALRAGATEIGMLQPYVDMRLRKIRSELPALDVRFFTGEVYALGDRVALRDKELELIFTVALSKGGANADAVVDALWPESEGDAARNAFHVCLHRLRKQAGDSHVVRRIGHGYALHPGAVVDLWQLESALAAGRPSVAGNREQLLALAAAFTNGRAKRAALGSWFAPFDRMLAHKMDELERLLAVPSAARV